ncbi:MAG: T9SS type A sorting domain-containing protein [Bacteroidales bacterium]|nr:T9SS type A sorting domain-containing protein [Bacteroidales bacterium]
MKSICFVVLLLVGNIVCSQIMQINDPYFQGGRIETYAKNSSCILVGTKGGIFKTNDNGQSWINVTPKLNNKTNSCEKLINVNNKFYALLRSTTYSPPQLYVSENNGETWSFVNGPFSFVQSIGSINNILYVIAQTTNLYLYSSTDGIYWQQKAMIMEGTWMGGKCEILSLNSNKLFIVLNNYVLYTTDGNILDTINFNGFSNIDYDKLSCDSYGNLYYCDNAIYKYDFSSNQWNNISSPYIDSNYFIISYSVTENNIFVFAMNQSFNFKVYKSNSSGNLFTEININVPYPNFPFVENIVEIDQNTFIGNLIDGKVVYSTDGGINWSLSTIQYVAMFAGNLVKNGNSLFVCREFSGVIKSSDNGYNWFASNNNLPSFVSLYFCNQIVSINNVLFLNCLVNPFSGQFAFYKSTDEAQNWQLLNLPYEYTNGTDYYFSGVCGNYLFLSYFDFSNNGYKFIVTNDYGNSWNSPYSQVFNNKIYFYGTQNNIFAFYSTESESNDFDNVFKVENYGTNLIDISNGIINQQNRIKRLYISGNYEKGTALMDIDEENNYAIFVIECFEGPNNGEKLYKYNLSNNSWSQIITNGLPNDCFINLIKYIGNNTWLLATNYGIYKSSDGGTTWTIITDSTQWLFGLIVNSIVFIDNTAILGTLNNGIWIAHNLLNSNTVTIEKIDVFPNPAHSYVYVNSKINFDTIKICNIKGELLKVYNGNNIINISEFPSGNYVLILESEGKKIIKYFVKN